MPRSRFGHLPAIFILSICSQVFGLAAETRQPVPDAAVQARADKLVKEVYGARIASAQTPEQKSELARTLLQRGEQTKEDPAGRYAVWSAARAVAIDAGDVPLTLSIVGEISAGYAVDAEAEKQDALTKLAAHPRAGQAPRVPAEDDQGVLKRVKELQERGWYAQAAAQARKAIADESTPAGLRSDLKIRAGKLLVLYAQSCMGFGNNDLSRRVLQDVTAASDVQFEASELGLLKSALRARESDAPAATPPAGSPLSGQVVWPAQPNGYAIDSPVQTGNSEHNHGGSRINGNLQVQSGVYIRGGTLRVSAGSITFKGAAAKPVFLDGVRVECEYTGSISAENTVFQNCSFAKTGGFFWNGGYSSKWTFKDCLFQNSSFVSLSRMDYGIRIGRCTFSDGNLPPRNWGYSKTESATDDGAKRTRESWSQLVDCEFYNCTCAVSSVWVAEGCNFYQCTVGKPANFLSKTDLRVEVGLPPVEKPFLDDLISETTSDGSGRVLYTSVRPFPRSHLSPFWKLLDGSKHGAD